MYASTLQFPSDWFTDFDELHRQLDHFLSPRSTSSIRAVGRNGFPALNMGATPEAIELHVFAPGIDPRTLEVSVDRGVLTIAGERRNGTPAEGGDTGKKLSVYARERAVGRFKRVVSLPEDADPDRISADYQDGVLHITVQKRETSKPRRIEIKDAH